VAFRVWPCRMTNHDDEKRRRDSSDRPRLAVKCWVVCARLPSPCEMKGWEMTRPSGHIQT